MFDTNVRDYFAMCVIIYLNFCVDYTWLLQAILNETVYLIIGGIPKFVMWDCVKSFFEINKTRIETLVCKYLYGLIKVHNVRMWSKENLLSIKLACPLALIPFNSIHPLIIIINIVIKLAKDCS